MNEYIRIAYQTTKRIARNPIFLNFGIKDKIMFYVLLKREKHYKRLNEEQKRVELKNWYFKQTGEKLDLECPKNFNQKIQWLKIYDNVPEKSILSDKYLVRNWVREKIGEKYLISLYGVWSNADDIDFKIIPKPFVLKSNHGSGMNLIINEKYKFNENRLRKVADRWLKTPYDMSGMEQQYYTITRRIIAEKFIVQKDGNLMDYKIHCFNGEPQFIQVIGDRNLELHTAKECYFDLKWNRNNSLYNTYQQYEVPPKKPECLHEMLEIASCLSKGFIYVRVDLYIIEEGIKFGEMTFTPASGIGKWGTVDIGCGIACSNVSCKNTVEDAVKENCK
ncbi:ATP-grasp fold amidoligase family protein [Enterocloster citroniae]|uniref:ATP-grasp fold amidoligase family protein n=1 Tax=Enterocloster citroniae TaxID=358743 RepID=UPI0008E57469|nr:ATP-grasp fold amidoligase family protein [Enterocloster citroniae]SFR95422.1 TupA-like ATPgrasp [Enterocloster citroniae]